jgi:uncharacterized membrane protein
MLGSLLRNRRSDSISSRQTANGSNWDNNSSSFISSEISVGSSFADLPTDATDAGYLFPEVPKHHTFSDDWNRAGAFSVLVSAIFSFILLGLLIVDYLAIRREDISSGLPWRWHSVLLYIHAFCFYLLLSGFIALNEASKARTWSHRIVKTTLALNIVSFGCRIVFELKYQGFYPPEYYPPEI